MNQNRFSTSELFQKLLQPKSLVILSLTVVVGCFFFELHLKRSLEELADRAFFLKQKQMQLQIQVDKEEWLTKRLEKADSDFVKTKLESMQFQESELKKVRSLVQANAQNLVHQNRLKFLSGQENRLKFKQQNYQSKGNLRETELIQKMPVEVCAEDVACLLATVEQQPIQDYHPLPGSPDFLVKRFVLQKKPKDLGGQSYFLQLDLIQREMTHE